MITVFTPTYNRAYTIERLYKSLLVQSFLDFEWLIVNDGSVDATNVIVDKFIQENRIRIRYYEQLNSGKHVAINKGVTLAKGVLFFIVDSDDFLTPNALAIVWKYYKEIEMNSDFAGICGLKIYDNGEIVGGKSNYRILDCNSLDFRYKYKIKGDVAEVFKTSILRDFPFPSFEKEKFCTEALVWNRIAARYKLRYFYEKLYICEYLLDGLSASFLNIHKNSPKGTILYYRELLLSNISFMAKCKLAIISWYMVFACNIRVKEVTYPKWSFFFSPLGALYKIIKNTKGKCLLKYPK